MASVAAAMPVIELSELQLDALAEAFNLALGEAAASFSQLVAEEIELSVPVVELASRETVIERLSALSPLDAGRLCGIAQQFDTARLFHTEALLVFPESGCLEIVRRMLGDVTTVETITELEQDALAEIGNIIINGCMSTLSNLFAKEIVGTLPVVALDHARALYERHCGSDHVLVAQIGMRLAVQDISGFVLFMMDAASLHALVGEVSQVFAI